MSSARTVARLQSEVRVDLAGGLAEAKFRGKKTRWRGARRDLSGAVDGVLWFTDDDELLRLYLKAHERETRLMLDMPFIWSAVEHQARQLIEHRELRGDALIDAIREGMRLARGA